MQRVLLAQTGLKFKTINKALKGRSQRLAFVISSKGGDIRLNFFGAPETAGRYRGTMELQAVAWKGGGVRCATLLAS